MSYANAKCLVDGLVGEGATEMAAEAETHRDLEGHDRAGSERQAVLLAATRVRRQRLRRGPVSHRQLQIAYEPMPYSQRYALTQK